MFSVPFNLWCLSSQPLSLKRLTEGLKGTKRADDSEISKLFYNVFSLHPPKVNFFFGRQDDLIKMEVHGKETPS